MYQLDGLPFQVQLQLDIVDRLLLELLKGPLGLRLQGEGQALQGLVLTLHADLSLHLIDSDLLELSLSRSQWGWCSTG